MTLPQGFMWGTGASSTQSEGSAPRSDWYRWEQSGRVPPSGEGNGFGSRYAEDFQLYAEYGLDHHRLSIEWARIEPEPGRRDGDAIEHYTEVLQAARRAGVKVWVCLHHFTLPGWFAEDEGGFLDERARSTFWPRHVDFVAETFGDLVHGWKPVNEPVAFAAAGWLLGDFPPGKKDVEQFRLALRATYLAQHEAWRLLRSGDQPTCTIMNLSPYYPGVRTREPDERERAQQVADLFDDTVFESWIRALRDGVLAVPGLPEEEIPEMAGSFDYIGFSYYGATTVYADLSQGPYPADARPSPLGYAPWSEGLGVVLRRLADELPGRRLLVAEHGVGTDDDDWRTEILDASLGEVDRAVADGIDVAGFFFWTGVDNYEWTFGDEVPFGLFDRDRNPRRSALLARRWATGT